MRPAKRAWQSRCRSATSSRTSARSCGRDKTERRTEGADRAKRFRRQSITESKKQRAKPLQFVLERTLLYTVAVVHILTLNPILGVKIGVRRTCENMLWNSLKPKPHFHLHPCTLQSRADVRRASVENRVCAPAVREKIRLRLRAPPRPSPAARSGPTPDLGAGAFAEESRGSISGSLKSQQSQAGAEGAPKRHNEACPPRPRHTRLSSSLELYFPRSRGVLRSGLHDVPQRGRYTSWGHHVWCKCRPMQNARWPDGLGPQRAPCLVAWTSQTRDKTYEDFLVSLGLLGPGARARSDVCPHAPRRSLSQEHWRTGALLPRSQSWKSSGHRAHKEVPI